MSESPPTLQAEPDPHVALPAMLKSIEFQPQEEIKKVAARQTEQDNELRSQRKILEWTQGFVLAILVVCVIAFITFLLDAWKLHSEVLEKNTTEIQALRRENSQLKEAAMLSRIDSLEARLARLTTSHLSTNATRDSKVKR